jgi:aldehyde:ferredoxin oxidoreductase
MNMFSGFNGKILRINLSTRTHSVQNLPEGFYREWFGGYGLGARILYSELKPRTDALGPDNILGFATGILTGVGAFSTGSYGVFCKSPLTGTWGDSRCGGYWGPELKNAGFDAVLFQGRATAPVYAHIMNDAVEIREAKHLWGKKATETEETIKDEVMDKKAQVACIGPSGERSSLIAAIMHDKGRAAGRSGVGAVMGSKNLKAVAVRGVKSPEIADPDRLRELTREWIQANLKDEDFKTFQKYGTTNITEPSALNGDSPVKNWGGIGEVDFPQAAQVRAEAEFRYFDKRYACYGCSIGCGAIVQLKGKCSISTHRPEYETASSFGSLLLNYDVESIIRCTDICNEYGLDTISAGTAVAFAIECSEEGLVDVTQTDNIRLRWGASEAIEEMTREIAEGKGFGAVLANGVMRTAVKIGKGSERYAMHVGGQELPMHDPKYTPGLATTYVADATPARHTQGTEWGLKDQMPGIENPEIKEKYDGSSRERAITHSIIAKNMHCVNALGVCQFPTIFDRKPAYEQFLNAVTGWNLTIHDYLEIGEKIAVVRQAFNIREGFRPSDFILPDRAIGRPPHSKGPLKGVTIDVSSQVREYFKLMDWDVQTGKPSQERLMALGLSDIAGDLYLRTG